MANPASKTGNGGGWPAGVATVLATLTGNAYLVVGSVVMGSLAILAAAFPPRGRWAFPVARLWARGLLLASGVRLNVTGSPRAAAGHEVVFMANHQSLYDIAVLLVSVPGRICFLAKRSLFRIPIFGWALAAAGFVPVDRADRSRARDAFTRAIVALESGVSIVIYPEETRSLDGRIRPFRSGGFLMALKAGAPIVPVGIRGTLRVRSKRTLAIRPGPVEVRYGEPIASADFGVRRKRELIAEVEREVASLAGAARAAEVG